MRDHLLRLHPLLSSAADYFASNPLRFGLVIVAFYLAAILPLLARVDFDTSALIVAGDYFVDGSKTLSPIIVRRGVGYDGQFYYRMAVDPFSFKQTAYGVTLDNPAWRTQRIIYPLIAWILACGQAAWVPLSLFLTNLTGIGVVAAFSARISARLHIPFWAAALVPLWPGFIISLTHDTTEIVAAALLLIAADRSSAGRIFSYALVMALALLTRETSVLFAAAVFIVEVIKAIRIDAWDASQARRILIAALAILPFLVWREAQYFLWGAHPQTGDLGWPAIGIFTTLQTVLDGTRIYSHTRVFDVFLRIHIAASVGVLLLFSAFIAGRIRGAFRCCDLKSAGAIGWLLTSTLMLMLRAEGPWEEPTAYLRALTEWFVIGCLIIEPKPPKLPLVLVAIGLWSMWIVAWAVSFAQSKAV